MLIVDLTMPDCFRHGGVSPGLSNGPSHRRVPYGRPSSGEVQEPATQTIIVTKDYKNSYGMKISGDKPVYVQSVNEGQSDNISSQFVLPRISYLSDPFCLVTVCIVFRIIEETHL